MSTVKISLIFIVIMMQACHKKQLIVTEIHGQHAGVVIQSIQISTSNHKLLLVCYSEVVNHRIQGISCQNDTGFHSFSGGIKNHIFHLEKVSSLLLKVKPITVLNYIRIALFDAYLIESTYKIDIRKINGKTLITDTQNHIKVEVRLL